MVCGAGSEVHVEASVPGVSGEVLGNRRRRSDHPSGCSRGQRGGRLMVPRCRVLDDDLSEGSPGGQGELLDLVNVMSVPVCLTPPVCLHLSLSQRC